MNESWQRKLAAPELAPEQLRDIIAQAIIEKLPETQVTVAGQQDLLISSGQTECQLEVFTGNAYLDLGSDWEERLGLVESHVAGAVASFASLLEPAGPVNKHAIVPRIKDSLFFEQEEVDRSYLTSLKRVHIAGDIFATFAESTGEGFTFLSQDDVAPLGLQDDQLIRLAVSNMQSRINPVEMHGSGPVHMLTCGGDFEACLLLDKDVWVSLAPRIEGDVIAAVPSRDLLYFTGDETPGGIERLASILESVLDDSLSYAISNRMLSYRNGQWRPYESE